MPDLESEYVRCVTQYVCNIQTGARMKRRHNIQIFVTSYACISYVSHTLKFWFLQMENSHIFNGNFSLNGSRLLTNSSVTKYLYRRTDMLFLKHHRKQFALHFMRKITYQWNYKYSALDCWIVFLRWFRKSGFRNGCK